MNPEKKEKKEIPSIMTTTFQELIPKCLHKFEMGIKSTELRVAYDAPTNQTTYTYTVAWDDGLKTEEKYKSAVEEASKNLQTLLPSDGKNNEEDKNEKASKKTEQPASESSSKSSLSSSLPLPLTDTSTWDTCQMRTSGVSSDSGTVSSETSRSSKPQPSGKDTSSNTSPSTSSSSTRRRFSKFSKAARLTNRSTHSLSLKSCAPSDSATSSSSCSDPPKGFVTDELKRVTAKLIVIDSVKFRGKLRVISFIDTTTSTRVIRVLRELLRDYHHDKELSSQQLIDSGALYFAFRDNEKPKLRRIRSEDVGILLLANLPKIGDSVVLILDLVGFVSKGKNIPIQLDLDSEEN